jgi:hypothetical protein
MSLFQEIKETVEGRELSVRWYQNQIRSLGGTRLTGREYIQQGRTEGNSTGRPTFGMLNLFYYRPKTDEKLPYYDIFPIVLPFKKHKNGFTGLNFHYLPVPLRAQLLDRMKVYATEEKLRVYWDLISSIRMVKPTVRRYNTAQVQSRFLQMPLEDMLLGILLPVQQFYMGKWGFKRKVPARSVWYQSRRIISGA